MNNVILTTKDNISPEDKDKLEKKGFMVIECADPAKFQFIDEKTMKLGNIVAESALEAISFWNHNQTLERFVTKLNEKYNRK